MHIHSIKNQYLGISAHFYRQKVDGAILNREMN